MLSLHELVQDGCSLVQFLFSASVSAIAVLEPTYWRWQGSSIGDDQLLENGQGSLSLLFWFVHPLLAKAQTERRAANALGKRPITVAATLWRRAHTWKAERRL